MDYTWSDTLKGQNWSNNGPMPHTNGVRHRIKIASIKFVGIIYYISVRLLQAQYLVLMSVITMLTKQSLPELELK